jgi:hypothetical protein
MVDIDLLKEVRYLFSIIHNYLWMLNIFSRVWYTHLWYRQQHDGNGVWHRCREHVQFDMLYTSWNRYSSPPFSAYFWCISVSRRSALELESSAPANRGRRCCSDKQSMTKFQLQTMGDSDKWHPQLLTNRTGTWPDEAGRDQQRENIAESRRSFVGNAARRRASHIPNRALQTSYKEAPFTNNICIIYLPHIAFGAMFCAAI